jgi:hypothetical protein
MDAPQQTLLFADVARQGDGRFLVTARKPASEVSTAEAARLLGVCRATMWYIRNTALGQQHLRWRFITSKKGKILWETDSVIAYRAATQLLED